MEEEYTNKKKVYTTKLTMQELGFTVVVILFFVQYYKILAFVNGRWILGDGLSFLSFYLLVLFIVVPASYFSTKMVVNVIKHVVN